MRSKGLVSIIMPAYNASSFISEAINSVINQTYVDWELIIVDDGSTDNTAETIKNWLEIDKRIQYFYQENGKQGKARNLGIAKSKGIYLAFLDADDLWLPEKLSCQVDEIQNKKADLVFSDSFIFKDQNLNAQKSMGVLSSKFYDKNDLQLFLEENKIPILTVLVKKEKVIEVNNFSENKDIQNVEDYHLWLKLLISGSIFYSSDKILAKYRVHDNSATSNERSVLNKIPNLLYDLISRYPQQKKLLEKELKLKFRLFYKRNLFTKSELSIWIKKNTEFLSKQNFNFIYQTLNFLLPTKMTKRLLMHILND